MHRYLLNISYIGTNFRGMQKTINKIKEEYLDTNTIQGCIDSALKVLKPVNEIQTVLSSRTDAGVHALHSTLHVDLQKPHSLPYETQSLTKVLNKNFENENLPIRILNTTLVPDTFHCRYNAKGRTYLYRLAIAREHNNQIPHLQRGFIPIEELDRCYFIQNSNFDFDKFIKCAQLFKGRHDFRSFMSISRQNKSTCRHAMFTLRSIDEITVRPSKSLAVGSNARLADELYKYLEVEIRGRSFLYKQVRRIVGSLVALATGRIDEKCIYEMLTIPSKDTWNNRISLAPASGLFLCQVHYNPEDLQFKN